MNRRSFVTLALSAAAMPGAAFAQAREPISALKIERSLQAPPVEVLPPDQRVTVRELKRNSNLRHHAPSIDIHVINFQFGSAEIPYSQFGKVEQIAIALRRILRRRPYELFLLEGHTDAVGSRYSNQILSQRRAESLRRVLVREFGLPWDALETVGYGEDFLLVPVPYEEWRNRRVTLRRITDVIRR